MPKTSLMLVHDSSAPVFDPSALRDADGEPRIRDVDLGFSLGVKNPQAAVRQLIKRNLPELAGHGEVRDAVSQTSGAGGRPGKEYWLNEAQALLICTFSRTAQAALVRKALIEVFLTYRQGRALGAPAALAQLTAEIGELRERVAAVEASRDPEADADLLYGVRAIAGFLGMPEKPCRHRCDRKQIPTFKIGGTICARRASIRSWLSAMDRAAQLSAPAGEVR